MEKNLHIICLDVPYPADYGGVYDLFYKLAPLQQQGIKIHLHCFSSGREAQPELTKYCQNVYYYPRLTGLRGLSIKYPYIVKSRSNGELADTIARDDYPILMEGTHCTWLLNDKRFTHRKCWVRLHNIEHVYYCNLFQFTKSPLKKLFFLRESVLLKKYEAGIARKATFLTVTETDAAKFKMRGCEKAVFLPLFLSPDWNINKLPGKGSYCLYHGDLGVAENDKAAKWLLENVFNELSIPFVIAGKNPSSSLSKMAEVKNSTCLIPNPLENEMQDLIQKAHINIIPSYNSTGIKLKLLNALFNGRFCIVNEPTIQGTGLEKACVLANDAFEFKKAITGLFDQEFSESHITVRHQLLGQLFDNAGNASKLIGMIWDE